MSYWGYELTGGEGNPSQINVYIYYTHPTEKVENDNKR